MQKQLIRHLRILPAVLGGEEKRFMVQTFPDLEHWFTQRKEFDEFFFEEGLVAISLDHIEELSVVATISIDSDTLMVDFDV